MNRSSSLDLLTELGRALGCTAPDPPQLPQLGQSTASAARITVCLSRALAERESAYYRDACELAIEHYQGRFKVGNRARSRARRERRRRREAQSGD